VAAAIGGPLYTVAAGALALGVCAIFSADLRTATAHHSAGVAFAAVAGVTAADALVSGARGRRDRELAEVRLVADAAQKVLLRPVPARVGPVRFSARYLSASSGARVGGDLYEVTVTPPHVRLVVGDAEGKGPAGAADGIRGARRVPRGRARGGQPGRDRDADRDQPGQGGR
jgi:hypothetical protein